MTEPDVPQPGVSSTPFSVLLPVYRGDSPEFFARSLASVTVEQTMPPDEVLVVQDGPVGVELADVLSEAEAGAMTGSVPVRVLRLSENVGLARALEAGLCEISTEVVARQDADDVSLPTRFACQLPLIDAGYELVGSALQEFTDDSETVPGHVRHGMVRRQPEAAHEIRRVLGWRDPFNHPTVMYRRSAVRAAGGYCHVDLLEDYWLFARMMSDGCRAINVPDVLVLYRVGAGAYERRGGWRLVRSELELQRGLHDLGLTNRLTYMRNVLVRCGYRLIPTAVRKTAYRFGHWLLARRA